MTNAPRRTPVPGHLRRAGRGRGRLCAAAVAGDSGTADDPGGAAHVAEQRDLGSGLILLPSSVAMFAVGVASGRLTLRFGAKMVLVAGTVISIVPFVLLTFAHRHQGEILVAMVLQGIGFGMAFAAMSNLVVQGVPPEQTGVASGMNANIRTIGGSIGAAVMGSIVTSTARVGGLPRESGYTHGFGLLTVAAIAAAVAAMLVPSTVRSLSRDTQGETMPPAGPGLAGAGTRARNESEWEGVDGASKNR